MARVERLCVRRLRSFMDYSNVAVELCASLDEGDNIDAVYKELVIQANALIGMTRLIEESKELQRQIAEEKKHLMEQVAKLRELLAELDNQKKQVHEALDEAHELLDKTLSMREKLLKAFKLR